MTSTDTALTALHRDYQASAQQAHLRYVDEREPGIRRRRQGKGFSYRRPDGTVVSAVERARCQALAVPPNWTDVWICARPDGHIQATGRDARGRKQYRYHPQWNELRQQIKYGRLLEFGEALPRLRLRLEADLSRRGLPEEKVVATVIALMAHTLIRVGNAEYARDNDSFGLTTLRDEHVVVDHDTVRFVFRGKSGKHREVDVDDRRLARIVRRCQELRGQELFTWLDADKQPRDVCSDDVNRYLRDATGQDFTAKDMRTWAGSVRCFRILRETELRASEAERRHALAACMRQIAAHLGNTPTVCRAYYVHPAVVRSWVEGTLATVEVPEAPHGGLGRSEHGLLRLLRELDA